MKEGEGEFPMKIRELTVGDDLTACIPVMRELRPHLPPNDTEVVERIRRQMEQGYRLLSLESGREVVALAGFRMQENLVFGRFLYIDDLVVAAIARKRGHAERLLDAVREIGVKDQREFLALDTAVTNVAAQRVYHRCGYETVAHHLIQRLAT